MAANCTLKAEGLSTVAHSVVGACLLSEGERASQPKASRQNGFRTKLQSVTMHVHRGRESCQLQSNVLNYADMNTGPDSHNRTFHQTAHDHMVVTSYSPPNNTRPNGGQTIEHPTKQHMTVWWSHCTSHQTTHDHMVVRSSYIPPNKT